MDVKFLDEPALASRLCFLLPLLLHRVHYIHFELPYGIDVIMKISLGYQEPMNSMIGHQQNVAYGIAAWVEPWVTKLSAKTTTIYISGE